MEKKPTTPKKKPAQMIREDTGSRMLLEVRFTANIDTSLSKCLLEKLTFLLEHHVDTQQFIDATTKYLANLLECRDLLKKPELVFYSGVKDNTKPGTD